MDSLHINQSQCRTLYNALKHYEDYLNQPNEMAVDNTHQRKEIKELLDYFNNNTSLGVKRYKLTNTGWQFIEE